MATMPTAIITEAATGIDHAVAQQLLDVRQAAQWQKVTAAVEEGPVEFVMLNAEVGFNSSWTDPNGR
ncbi:unnamed protein product, partial [Rotaria sp. Silwood1]